MSRISFFQRYSQKENHATNNVLLALRYVYETSPQKLQNVVRSLLQDDFEIGLSFRQQERGADSVPDAVISQTQLNIYFETKTQGDLEEHQIRRHISSIREAAHGNFGSVLMGLSPNKPNTNLIESSKEYAKKHYVRFEVITFRELLEALEREFEEYETTGRAVIEDLRAYLEEENLISNAAQQLFVVPCSKSFKENILYGIYYEPTSRPSKAAYGYLGLYKDKAVRAIGRIRKCIEFDASSPSQAESTNSVEDINLVKKVIEQTPYYNLGSDVPHRYYLVEKFYSTEYRKESKGGMRKNRTFDLTEKIGLEAERMSVEEIAENLKSKTWT